MQKECCVDGCDTKYIKVIKFKADNKYYCNRHYQQMKKNGKIPNIKTKTLPKDSECYYCGSKGKLIRFKGDHNIYCVKHYDQMRLYGKILNRTIFDKNKIIYNKDYAEIILYDLKQNENGRVLIDLEDIDKVKDIKWNLGSHGYAANTTLKICLHNLIIQHKENELVDHINRNKLDNRKCNLRIVTYEENSINKSQFSNNTSGFMGVCWDKNNCKWMSQITVNKKYIYLGRFSKKENAIIARLKAELKYFGKEFAPQRHLFEKYNIV